MRVDAAGTGQQAEGDLGEAELRLGIVQRDAVVAGERDLQPAAERGPVERGHDRLAECLQRAQVGFDALDVGAELGHLVVSHLAEQSQVAAGEEGVLRGGDDDAADRVTLGLQSLHGVGERGLEGGVHRVGAVIRIVDRQRDNAVRILGPVDHADSTLLFAQALIA